MFVSINTGADAVVEGVEKITASDLGVRYSGFRSIDRFIEQIKDLHVGLISWPGGTLAEESTSSYGLEFHDLTSADSKMPSLSEMMQIANDQGAELSVVLPTVRYSGHIDEMRVDIQNFMQDLLSGEYGHLPERLIFHVGSEHYAHFQGLSPDGAAAEYGRVAAAMVEELTHALNDPTVNLIGADIDLSVQAGRTMAEDETIRDSFSDESLANVDLVMHHRYAAQAEGIDFNLKPFSPILDAWQQDVTEVGGEPPQIHLSEWNVASVTRSEGLTSYIRDMAKEGMTVHRSDIDLAGRTSTEFENFWQELLSTRDYGVAVPKLYLELFSEYQAEGLGAASIHAADLMHAGRMTYTDVDGNPVQFVGAEMISMIYESVEGTQVLEVSEENTRSSDLWTYAYEGDDRVVVFLASDDDTVVGDVTVQIEGLDSGYAAVWTESLTSEVPADWMERFGVPDNPNVDESNEGQTYALGVRGDVETTIEGDQVTVTFTQPGQVVRILVAHSQEEAALISEWAGDPDFEKSAGSTAEFASVDHVSDSASLLLPLAGVDPSLGSSRHDAEEIGSPYEGSQAGDYKSEIAGLETASQIVPPAPVAPTYTSTASATISNSALPAQEVLAQDDTEAHGATPDTSFVHRAAASTGSDTAVQGLDHSAFSAIAELFPEAVVTTPDTETHEDPSPDANEPDTEAQSSTGIEAGDSDDDLSQLLLKEEDVPEEQPEEEDDQPSSMVAEISTFAGSAFGAALMGLLASLARFM